MSVDIAVSSRTEIKFEEVVAPPAQAGVGRSSFRGLIRFIEAGMLPASPDGS